MDKYHYYIDFGNGKFTNWNSLKLFRWPRVSTVSPFYLSTNVYVCHTQRPYALFAFSIIYHNVNIVIIVAFVSAILMAIIRFL